MVFRLGDEYNRGVSSVKQTWIGFRNVKKRSKEGLEKSASTRKERLGKIKSERRGGKKLASLRGENDGLLTGKNRCRSDRSAQRSPFSNPVNGRAIPLWLFLDRSRLFRCRSCPLFSPGDVLASRQVGWTRRCESAGDAE